MFAQLPYRLTEYTDFRQLEFSHSQLKDQHASLAAKLITLQQMYRQALAHSEAQRREALRNQARLEAIAEEAQGKLSDLLAFAEGIHGELKDVARVGIDLGAEFELPRSSTGSDRAEEAKWVFNQLLKCLMVAVSRNNELSLRLEKEGGHLRGELREHKRRKGELRAEINYLSEQLERMESSSSALLGEVGVLKRENLQQRAQLQECCRPAQEESVLSERDGHIEDNNFALDLLSHDKELLERIFARVLSALPAEQLAQTLADLYASYEAVAEAFREKLQVEYDLEDLEREYKREKNSRVAEGLLIELRKQIENFRSELHRQKEELGKQEEQLEQHFAELEAQGREEQRTRNYTLDVEKKLRDIQSYNATKRNAPEADPQSSRIQFRATAKAEEVMKEMLRRDRENIERIFKETRSQLGRQ